MSILFETSLGDFVIDLNISKCPKTTTNFIKLCKIKYYNNILFHKVVKDFMVQTGDPNGNGTGGDSIYKLLGNSNRYIEDEIYPNLTHQFGSVSMASAGPNKNASQFFIVTAKHSQLEHLKNYTIIGQIAEGMDTIMKINDSFVNEKGRPLQNIRIRHTIILEDPFKDPIGLSKLIPETSPERKPDRHDLDFIPDDFDLDQKDERTEAEIERDENQKRAKMNSKILETLRDIPNQDIRPEENILFVCKLNPVTTDEDLNTVFSQFGTVISCQIVRDYKTGDSLQYAFIEFATKDQCEIAYLKMDNVLLDDRRIKVDWSQSVSRQWPRFNSKDSSVFESSEFKDKVKKEPDKNDYKSKGLSDKRKIEIKSENRNTTKIPKHIHKK